MFAQLAGLLALSSLAIGAPRSEEQKRESSSAALTSNINQISQYFGQISPYSDNPENYFGVDDVGLPDGCQIEQVHSLQRHAQRFPTGGFDDGENDMNFAAKVYNYTIKKGAGQFTGALEFLNSYSYQMGESYLTGIGASTEFASGVTFWNRYGRTLYNASLGQVQYNATYQNLTKRAKPVLRTTSQSRIENSQISWALGFFGPSFEFTPQPGLNDFVNGSLFDVVIIPEGGTENNTLASYDSCFEDDFTDVGSIGDLNMFHNWVPKYLANATARMNKYAPKGFTFNANDTYAMQSICAYETAYIGMSDFCGLFTLEEWQGFDISLSAEYYFDYSFGQPTGRAQGLGYVQELLARLTNQYITSSNSSVNHTITNNAKDFPLGRPFYCDFSHDDILISVMTAMSIDYFHVAPDLKTLPPKEGPFRLSKMTPFGGRLITEVIGCASASPTAQESHRTYYTPTQYGYNPKNASHKFIRMRLNNGILPLKTIRGGACAGRSDGLCAMSSYVNALYGMESLANYQFACFANYTLNNPTNGMDFDGTVKNGTAGVSVHPGMITAEYIDNVLE